MSAVPTSIGSTITNTTAQTAERAERIADEAIHAVRDRLMPAATRLATQAEDIALRSAEALRERGQHLRERAAEVGERSVRYVKDEPVKSVLIAAAAGAVFVAALSVLSSRRRPNL